MARLYEKVKFFQISTKTLHITVFKISMGAVQTYLISKENGLWLQVAFQTFTQNTIGKV
jgi:hypothetical protein